MKKYCIISFKKYICNSTILWLFEKLFEHLNFREKVLQ